MKYKIISIEHATKRLVSYDKDFFQWSDLLFWMEQRHHISDRHKVESANGYNYFAGDNSIFPSVIAIRMTSFGHMDIHDDDDDDFDDDDDDDEPSKIPEIKMIQPVISRGKLSTFLVAYRTGSIATFDKGNATRDTINFETLMINLFGSLFNVDFTDAE